MKRHSLILCAGATAMVAAHSAMAQEQPTETTPGATASGIQEIIVTAQKRSESSQSVPISLAAVNSDTLAKTGSITLDAVQHLTPGITLSTVGSGFVSYTYIRGAGTNVLDAGADPSVAYFVDEVYQAGTAGLQGDLLDVERVEVLKGPQGTLFGRNAAAGAVSVITRRPEARFNAWVNGEAGLYSQYAASGGITGPLSADGGWRYRIAGAHRERGAYTDNPAGLDPGFLNTYSGRASIERTGGAVTLLISGDYFHARNGMTNHFLSTQDYTGILNAAAYAALPSGQDFFRRYYDVNGYENQDAGSVTGRLEWDLGGAQLTAISAYRNSRFRRLQDQDGTAADALTLASQERDYTFSQELRLAGETGRFQWLLGGYFYDNVTRRHDVVRAGSGFVVPAFAAFPGDYNVRIKTRSYAVFGQASFAITPTLSLTAGGRYTRDEKTSDQNTDPLGPVGRFQVHIKPSWDSFDPAVTLQFKPSRALMVYASYRQGFKSGGFQSLPGSAALAASPFDPEKVQAYELGFKSNLLDRKLLFNVALFHNDIIDQQILRVPAPNVTLIDNAGRTKADGADVTLSILPVTNLRIDASATWQRARFKRYTSGALNFAGNHQLRSPDLGTSIAAEYTVPVRGGSIALRGDYFHQSTVFFDAANTKVPGGYQPAYDLLNARVSFRPGDGNLDVSIYAKNLTDTRYFRNVAFQGGSGFGAPGDPLTAGISIGWKLR